MNFPHLLDFHWKGKKRKTPGPRCFGLRTLNYIMKTGVQRCTSAQVMARQGGVRPLRGQTSLPELRRLWDESVFRVVKYSRHRNGSLTTRKLRAKKKKPGYDPSMNSRRKIPTRSKTQLRSYGYSSGSGEYEVSRIIGRRLVIDKQPTLEYLVCWKGYGKAYNTWEPERNLLKARQKIEEYLRVVDVNGDRGPAFTQCQLCDRRLLKIAYETHMKEHETDSVKSHVCPLCRRAFGERGVLDMHIGRHKDNWARKPKKKRAWRPKLNIVTGRELVGKRAIISDGPNQGKSGMVIGYDSYTAIYRISISQNGSTSIQNARFHQLRVPSLGNCRGRSVYVSNAGIRRFVGKLFTSSPGGARSASDTNEFRHRKRIKIERTQPRKGSSSTRAPTHTPASVSTSTLATAPTPSASNTSASSTTSTAPTASTSSSSSSSSSASNVASAMNPNGIHWVFGVRIRVQNGLVALKDLLSSLDFRTGSYSDSLRPFLLYLQKLEPNRLLSLCVQKASGFGSDRDQKITAITGMGIYFFSLFFADKNNGIPYVEKYGKARTKERIAEFARTRRDEFLRVIGENPDKIKTDVEAYMFLYQQKYAQARVVPQPYTLASLTTLPMTATQSAITRTSNQLGTQPHVDQFQQRQWLESHHQMQKSKLQQFHQEQNARLYRLQQQQLVKQQIAAQHKTSRQNVPTVTPATVVNPSQAKPNSNYHRQQLNDRSSNNSISSMPSLPSPLISMPSGMSTLISQSHASKYLQGQKSLPAQKSLPSQKSISGHKSLPGQKSLSGQGLGGGIARVASQSSNGLQSNGGISHRNQLGLRPGENLHGQSNVKVRGIMNSALTRNHQSRATGRTGGIGDVTQFDRNVFQKHALAQRAAARTANVCQPVQQTPPPPPLPSDSERVVKMNFLDSKLKAMFSEHQQTKR